jgi:hypothetical protein
MKRRRRDEDDRVIEDGETVRIGLMDGSPLQQSIARFAAGRFDPSFHRSGFVEADSAEVRDARRAAREARDAYVKQLGDAWRRATPAVASSSIEERRRFVLDEASAQAMKEAAYKERNRALTEAWRSAPNARADEVEQQRRRVTNEGSR